MMRNSKSPDLSLFLLIARIGKTRGLRGEFFLRSFAEDPQSLNTFTKFYTLNSSLMEEVDFEYIKTANSNTIAKINSIDDIDAIKLFGQKDVYVLRSELPQLDENEDGVPDLNEQQASETIWAHFRFPDYLWIQDDVSFHNDFEQPYNEYAIISNSGTGREVLYKYFGKLEGLYRASLD